MSCIRSQFNFEYEGGWELLVTSPVREPSSARLTQSASAPP